MCMYTIVTCTHMCTAVHWQPSWSNWSNTLTLSSPFSRINSTSHCNSVGMPARGALAASLCSSALSCFCNVLSGTDDVAAARLMQDTRNCCCSWQNHYFHHKLILYHGYTVTLSTADEYQQYIISSVLHIYILHGMARRRSSILFLPNKMFNPFTADPVKALQYILPYWSNPSFLPCELC